MFNFSKLGVPIIQAPMAGGIKIHCLPQKFLMLAVLVVLDSLTAPHKKLAKI